jgi:hypothetical protein
MGTIWLAGMSMALALGNAQAKVETCDGKAAAEVAIKYLRERNPGVILTHAPKEASPFYNPGTGEMDRYLVSLLVRLPDEDPLFIQNYQLRGDTCEIEFIIANILVPQGTPERPSQAPAYR